MEVWATKGGTFLKAEASHVLASGTWRQYAPAMKSSGLIVFLYCSDSGRWHFFPAPHHCITLGPPCWPLNNMDGLHIIQCKIFQLSWDFHKDHPSCLISRSLAPTNMPHLCPDGSTWLDPGEAGGLGPGVLWARLSCKFGRRPRFVLRNILLPYRLFLLQI
jgi:hypothetical protein